MPRLRFDSILRPHGTRQLSSRVAPKPVWRSVVFIRRDSTDLAAVANLANTFAPPGLADSRRRLVARGAMRADAGPLDLANQHGLALRHD